MDVRSLLLIVLAVAVLAACDRRAVPVDAGDCRVQSVTDGDTIRVTCLDASVRLLLVDAPEVGSGGECYGREARDYLRTRLPRGTSVTLQAGVLNRDRYGRYLRYVFVGDELINETLVRMGYATRYRAAEDTTYRDQIAAAEAAARGEGAGLWSACTRALRPRAYPPASFALSPS